jgi:predicted outer membrane repeat protein
MRCTVAILGALLLIPSASLATTWYVPTQCLTIQAGVDSAAVGDTVLVAAGTYTGTGNRDIIFGGKNIVVKSESGRQVTIIDSQGTVADRHRGFLFDDSGETSAAVIDGFTIRGGYKRDGGGIYCYRASPTIQNCTFESNSGFGSGGGVYCEECAPTIQNCVFTDNWCSVDGGGLCCLATDATINTCEFDGNHAYAGGGFFCGIEAASGFPKVELCTFSGNSADNHGGGACCGILNGRARFADCVFTENTSSHNGGGLDCRNSCEPRIRRCTFEDNIAVDSGGGIGLADHADAIIEDCDFVGNAATSGGGLNCRWDSSADLSGCTFSDNFAVTGGGASCHNYGYDTSTSASFSTCVFAGNSAEQNGGGIANSDSCSMLLIRCTLSQNSAIMAGGAAYCSTGGNVQLSHSIIAFSVDGEAVACSGGAANLLCCDVYGNEGGDWVGCIAGQYGISYNFSMDPEFCNVYTGDYSIAAGSPCAPDNPPVGCGLVGALDIGCSFAAVPETEMELPNDVCLRPNVPNPFNPITQISYGIPAGAGHSRAALNIYDALGRQVRTLVEEDRAPGIYHVVWDGTNSQGHRVASGVYFCRLMWNGETRTQRMVLLK